MTRALGTTPSRRPVRKPSPEGVLIWMDLMESCEQLLLAGLRRKVGPAGDVTAAYRDWNSRQMGGRLRELTEMLDPQRRIEKRHAH